MPPCYKHAAPLGLNTAQLAVRYPSWGLWLLGMSRCYKHAAPLGLNAESNRQTDMSAIVGAWFPRPAGWGTQPLRIPRSRFPCVVASLR